MRLISFFHTQEAVRKQEKTVTRREGWASLKPGTRLRGCKKCQGRKKGEPIEELCKIEVVSVRRERLNRMVIDPEYGQEECIKEGFPDMTPLEFVSMFCSNIGGEPSSMVTRIEFKYVEGGGE